MFASARETFVLNGANENKLSDPERQKVIGMHADKAESIILNDISKPMTGSGKTAFLIRWRKVL